MIAIAQDELRGLLHLRTCRSRRRRTPTAWTAANQPQRRRGPPAGDAVRPLRPRCRLRAARRRRRDPGARPRGGGRPLRARARARLARPSTNASWRWPSPTRSAPSGDARRSRPTAAHRRRVNGGETVGVNDLRGSPTALGGPCASTSAPRPGVGKTFAMLNEGRRRRERGADVVVGFVETHGRDRTAEQIGDLEVMPRRRFDHRGSTLTRWTSTPSCAAAPSSCSSTSWPTPTPPARATRSAGRTSTTCWPPASTSSRRSTSSTSSRSTTSSSGSPASASARRSPTTWCGPPTRSSSSTWRRRRCAGGSPTATSTGADKIDAALGNYFRAGNLSALRELALLWVADRVDDSLQDYRERHGITGPWETRERIVVALAGAPGTDHLVRRAARIAQRAKGDLIGVHVVADSGLLRRREHRRRDGDRRAAAAARGARRRVPAGHQQRRRRRARRPRPLGERHPDRARRERALAVARAVQRIGDQPRRAAVGADRRARHLGRPTSDGGAAHGDRRLPAVRRCSRRCRRAASCGAGCSSLVGLPLITLCVRQPPRHVRAAERAAAVPRAGDGGGPRRRRAAGGRRRGRRVPARQLVLHAAVPPADIADGENVLALVVYVVAAGIVAVLVDRVGRSRLRAARLQAEAEALAALAGSLARPARSARCSASCASTFGFRAAALLRRDARRLGRAGRRPASSRRATPERADVSRDLGRGVTLALAGGALSADDERVLNSFAAQVAAAAERERLQVEAGRAADLAAANTCGPRCCRPCRTTCARRWRRSRRRSRASASATSSGRPTTSRSSRRRSRGDRPPRPTSSATSST